MSTTTLSIYSIPTTKTGVTLTAGSVAWLYGAYVPLAVHTRADIYVWNISFQYNIISGLDTANQFIIDIGVGNAGAEVVVAQMPHSFRADTAVGHLMQTVTLFFPEPFFVPRLSRISVRAASSITNQAYSGLKLGYMSDTKLIDVADNVYPANYQRFTATSGGVNVSGVI